VHSRGELLAKLLHVLLQRVAQAADSRRPAPASADATAGKRSAARRV
jgi:hypothetical protein